MTSFIPKLVVCSDVVQRYSSSLYKIAFSNTLDMTIDNAIGPVVILV